jgi:hypothetical protein
MFNTWVRRSTVTDHGIDPPRAWRAALGFVLAPVVPAVLWGIFGPGDARVFVAIAAAIAWGYPVTLLLGVAVYFYLYRRVRPRFFLIVPIAGIIAAAPAVLLLHRQIAVIASNGTCQASFGVNEPYCGLLDGAQLVAIVFGLGCIGGFAFWLIVAWPFRSTRWA